MATRRQSSVRDRIGIGHPSLYDVLILNDDFTTMDFVVYILKNIFYKSESEALALMLAVHNTGQGLAGTYVLDIAQAKVAKATACARQNGFPLNFKIQEHTN